MQIVLTDGCIVLVDDEDYEWLSQFKWGHHLCITNDGYARRWGSINGGKPTNILMHREIMHHPEGFEIDHENHNTLDNRRANLRIVTKHQNMANARKTTNPRSSQFKGVTWYKAYQLWSANIMRNGVRYHLGYFETESEAAVAYNQKTIELAAEHSHLHEVPPC